MNKEEFGRNYATLEEAFGARANRGDGHMDLWWKKFGNWPCDLFAETVDFVVDNHRSFGSDKWPTIGDFRHLTNQMLPTKNKEQEAGDFKDPMERRYNEILWQIKQQPLADRNSLLKRATEAMTTKTVPEFMKAACECEQLTNAVLQNLQVRIFCEEKGRRCPV